MLLVCDFFVCVYKAVAASEVLIRRL
jgi:hypothetical protein